MTRYPFALLLLAAVFVLSGCETPEDEASTDKKASTAAQLPVPSTPDDNLWKAYLGQEINKHTGVVTDRVISYYLRRTTPPSKPTAAASTTACPRASPPRCRAPCCRATCWPSARPTASAWPT
jgi:hypothetical protein